MLFQISEKCRKFWKIQCSKTASPNFGLLALHVRNKWLEAYYSEARIDLMEANENIKIRAGIFFQILEFPGRWKFRSL